MRRRFRCFDGNRTQRKLLSRRKLQFRGPDRHRRRWLDRGGPFRYRRRRPIGGGHCGRGGFQQRSREHHRLWRSLLDQNRCGNRGLWRHLCRAGGMIFWRSRRWEFQDRCGRFHNGRWRINGLWNGCRLGCGHKLRDRRFRCNRRRGWFWRGNRQVRSTVWAGDDNSKCFYEQPTLALPTTDFRRHTSPCLIESRSLRQEFGKSLIPSQIGPRDCDGTAVPLQTVRRTPCHDPQNRNLSVRGDRRGVRFGQREIVLRLALIQYDSCD